MAKLRIEDNAGNLIVDDYVRVIEGIFFKDGNGNYPNYQDFIEADPEERPALLQQFVTGGFKITQLRENNTKQVIDGSNCAIICEKDRRKKANVKRSRVTVPMPDAPPEPTGPGAPVFAYLVPYAQQIKTLLDAGDIDKCTKFMFGVMLLTRCR